MLMHGFFIYYYLELRYKSCSHALPYTVPLRDKINIWYMLVIHIKVDATL